MKIEIESNLNGTLFKEIFESGCFGDKNIGISFTVEEDEWKEEDDKMIRIIKKAKLIDVSIQTPNA